MSDYAGGAGGLVNELIELLNERGGRVATAESLTGGQLASVLAAAPRAEEWYCGGIVAYRPAVKYSLLRAPEGPVVTAATAEAMACSAATLCCASYAVAVTGVGGPEPQEGRPPGTVYLATSEEGARPRSELHRFEGEPIDVIAQTISAALSALLERIRETAS